MSYQIAKPVSEKPVGLTGSEINDCIFKIKKNTGNIRAQIERIRNSDKDFDYDHCCELHKNPSSSIAVGIAHVKYSGFDSDSDGHAVVVVRDDNEKDKNKKISYY